MNPGKLIGALIGVFFALAGPALVFGAGVWWENRAAGWPNLAIGPCPICVHLGFGSGPGAKLAQLQADEAAAAKRVAAIEASQNAISQLAGGQEAKAQVQIRTVFRTIKQQVPYAIPPAADAVLPVGWVRVHNEAVAALSVLPGPPLGPDDAPSGVRASNALGVVVDNYGACHQSAERLSALQAWVVAESNAAAPLNRTAAP